MNFLYPWILFFLLPLVAYVYKERIDLKQKAHLKWVVLMLLIVALARPIVEYRPTLEEMPVGSVVVALDLSYSMRAKDIKPTRLEASRAIIKEFLSLNPNDKIALIGFTTHALMLSPLTQDHRVVTMALDSLKDEYILTKGTSIHKLLQKVAQFPDESKTLVILSDGGDEPLEDETIALARTHNITIIAPAMATPQGASIDSDEGVLRDTQGNIVISRLNPMLEHLAKATGGEFITFGDRAARAIHEAIENLNQAKIIAQQSIQSYYDLYSILVLIAMALLLHAYTTIYLKIIALLALWGVHLHGGVIENYYLTKAHSYFEKGEYNQSIKTLTTLKPSQQSQMLLANSYYKLQAYHKAKALYQSIQTTNPALKHQLYHNLGNCEAQLHYYDKAKNYYIKALQLSKSPQTWHNLELVTQLQERFNAQLGTTNPTGGASQSNDNEEDFSEKEGEEESNEGSSGSGSSTSDRIKLDTKALPSPASKPISSKAYELINKGYIHEEKPW